MAILRALTISIIQFWHRACLHKLIKAYTQFIEKITWINSKALAGNEIKAIENFRFSKVTEYNKYLTRQKSTFKHMEGQF